MKKRSKLLLAVSALCVSLAVSATATFAWFTTNEKVSVSGIDATVTTANSGIEVSATQNGTYSTTLSLAQAINAWAGELNHVTSADKGATITQKDGTTVAGEKEYFATTIWFRSTGKMSIKATATALKAETSSNITTTIRAWDGMNTEYTAKGIVVDSEVRTYVDDAVRVSFANKVVWEPNKDAGASQLRGTANLAGDYYTFITGQSAGVVPDGAVNSWKSATEVAAVELLQLGTGADEEPDASGYYYGSLEIKVWLEGWDEDCLNCLFGQKVSIGLGFTGTEIAVAP